MNELKVCSICKNAKERTEFPLKLDASGKRYTSSPCKSCHREREKLKYQSTGRQVALKRYYDKRDSTTKLRDIIHSAYGNKCVCCGQTDRLFLTIDHANGGGEAHRKSHNHSAYAVFRDIIKGGFSDEYRLLCWNCNLATRYGKECPHQLYETSSLLEGLAC